MSDVLSFMVVPCWIAHSWGAALAEDEIRNRDTSVIGRNGCWRDMKHLGGRGTRKGQIRLRVRWYPKFALPPAGERRGTIQGFAIPARGSARVPPVCRLRASPTGLAAYRLRTERRAQPVRQVETRAARRAVAVPELEVPCRARRDLRGRFRRVLEVDRDDALALGREGHRRVEALHGSADAERAVAERMLRLLRALDHEALLAWRTARNREAQVVEPDRGRALVGEHDGCAGAVGDARAVRPRRAERAALVERHEHVAQPHGRRSEQRVVRITDHDEAARRRLAHTSRSIPARRAHLVR